MTIFYKSKRVMSAPAIEMLATFSQRSTRWLSSSLHSRGLKEIVQISAVMFVWGRLKPTVCATKILQNNLGCSFNITGRYENFFQKGTS